MAVWIIMELRQLEYFLMVSKVNSFTRAAERLYVSQPTVTNAVRSLEDELGIQLFDRSQKQAILTTEGKVFCNHVENLMHDVVKTISTINDLKNLNNGVIQIGLTPLAGIYPAPQLLAKFKNTYPALQLVFIEENVPDIHKLLIEDKLDLGITICDNNTSIKFSRLSIQELVFCCYKDHSLAEKENIELTELIHEPFITFKEGCLLRNVIVDEFTRINTMPSIAFESNHIQTIKNLIACKAGISILPKDLCENDANLTCIPLKNPLTIEVCISQKKNKYISHATQAFLNLSATLFDL